jgi:SAM-dependent methyltransferase
VLTHIDDQAQLLWLAELRRILRPGGVAVVSVYGEYAFEGYRSGQLRGITRDIRERLGTHESLHAAGAVFAPYRRTALNTFNFVGGDEAYGISFNSPGQVRREWTSALDVVEILPRSWWSTGQDLVILEKPRDTPPPKGSSDWRPRQVASA